MEKSQPGYLGSRHRDAGFLASWDENLPCNHDCWASPASRANTFSSLNLASEQNGSPEDRYFSSYITHKGLSDYVKLKIIHQNNGLAKVKALDSCSLM